MGDRPIPVYNQDGSTFGSIDEDEHSVGLSGDYYQPDDDGSDDDRVRSSIWGEDQDDNPAEGYRYSEPKKVPTNRPQGFWGAGGGGNPAWGAPTPGQRWGDDPTGGYDPRTGMPGTGQEGHQHRGSVRYSGPLVDVKRRYRKEAAAIMEKYNNVRHPTRRLKAKIKADLSAKLPKSEVRKIMKSGDWL